MVAGGLELIVQVAARRHALGQRVDGPGERIVRRADAAHRKVRDALPEEELVDDEDIWDQ